jgi:hypothetical protein
MVSALHLDRTAYSPKMPGRPRGFSAAAEQRVRHVYSLAACINDLLTGRIIPRGSEVYLSAIADDAMTEKDPPQKASPGDRRKTMKTMLLAAAAALSLGVGSAYANDSQGQAGGYAYPDYVFPGSISGGVQAPAQTEQNSQAIHAFVTRSANQGTWLFAPAQGGNG